MPSVLTVLSAYRVPELFFRANVYICIRIYTVYFIAVTAYNLQYTQSFIVYDTVY